MTKNARAKMFTGIESVALSSLSDYINKRNTEALAELIRIILEEFKNQLGKKEKSPK